MSGSVPLYVTAESDTVSHEMSHDIRQKKQAASEASRKLKRGSEANPRARRAKQGVPAPAGCLPHSKTASGERSGQRAPVRPSTVFCQGVRGDFEFCKERTRECTTVLDRENDAGKARNPPQSRQKKWSQLSDLNRRPGDYKSTALPTELSWHLKSVAIQYSKNRNLQTFS